MNSNRNRRRSTRRPAALAEALEGRRLFAGVLQVRDASIDEGDAGTRTLSFWIDLAGPSGTSVVTATTSDGSASAAEGDYTAASQTFVFNGADTRKFFNVTVRGDTRDEATETLTVTLSNTNGTAVIADGTAVGTIVEDDDHPPTATLGPVVPNFRDTPVSSIDIRFSESVMGFDVSDLTLTRDGGPNLLTASQTLTLGAAPDAWTLNNLAGITGVGGGYLLSLSGDAAVTGIMDGDYNPLAAGASVGWANYSPVVPDPGPVVADGPEFRVNTHTPSDQALPATAMDADGDFVVVWQSNGQDQVTGTNEGVYGQRYSADGAPQGGEFRVNTTVAGNQMRPQVAMNAAGEFVVVWESPDISGIGIFAQRYNAAGVPQGGEFRVNATTTQPQTYPAVAMAGDGRFAVTWVSYSQDLPNSDGVYAQVFAPDGAPVGPEFRVNTEVDSLQRYPTIAMNLAGDFVIAWSSDLQDPDNSTGIYAQRFDNMGTRRGGEFRVNSYTVGDQFEPSAAMDANGNFVVTWHGLEVGGNYGIYARRFDAAGTARGLEFKVSTTVPGFQRYTAVAMDGDGDFVIAWQDEHSGPTPGFTSVMARRYASDGAPVTGEFLVNTTNVGHHRLPAAAMDADGDFVIAWAGFGQDPGDSGNQAGVYAQRYGRARAPRVAAAYVRGSGWATPFLSYLDAHGLGSSRYGYALAGGAGQLADLPWRNLDQVSIAFSRDVAVEQRHLVVRGTAVAVYPISGFAYDPTTRVATWTLAQAITNDRLVLDLDGDFRTSGVTAGGGGLLMDGEWTTGGAFPSGDGTPAGDFKFNFEVLPGNVNRTGPVLADDFSSVKARFFRSTTNPGTGPTGYSIFHDVDGSGSILADDFSNVKARFFTTLPGPEPL